MAILPFISFPGKVTFPASGYPLGKAQNITTPGDGTGTPWDEAVVNDWFGFFQTLLYEGLIPGGGLVSGNADEYGASQYYQACRRLFGAVFVNIFDLQSTDSSELRDGTIAVVAEDTEFMFAEVKTGTVTGDGVRLFPFTDDANRYAERITKSYLFDWSGNLAALPAADFGYFLLAGGTYSTTAPAAAGYRFPVGAKLTGVAVSNKGSHDIAGLAFYADPSPSSSQPDDMEYRLTAWVDVPAGATRFVPVVDEAPELSSAMALGYAARKIYGTTEVTIQFVYELQDDAQDSVMAGAQRGDRLALVEAAGAVDLADRIADNNYPMVRPDYGKTPTTQYIVKNVKLGGQQNIQQYSETPGTASWYSLVSSSASLDTADTVDIDVDGVPVTLTRIKDTSANTLFKTAYSSAPGAPSLAAGYWYMMSFYVLNATEGEARFHMRAVGPPLSNPGHGQRLATDKPRRVWTKVLAGNTTEVYAGDSASGGYFGGTLRDINWFEAKLAALVGDLADVYIGGFQFERMHNSHLASDGIALIGDETMAGVDAYPAFSNTIRAAGRPDDIRSVQVSRWVETELNARTFNRAMAGDTLDDMAARWATDMTPMAAYYADYVIIQGGANDMITNFEAGDSSATVLSKLKVSIAALATLAAADNYTPVYLTVSPHRGIYGDLNGVRQAYNAWLKSEYPLVIDINQVLESSDGASIVRQPGYTTDGFNFGPAAKKAVGEFIARQQFWTLPEPTPYQKAATTTVDDNVGFELNGLRIYTGSGSPEGVVAAVVGSRYWNEAPTGAGDAQYVKITGAGATGWVAV